MSTTAPPPLHMLAVKSAVWYGAARLWGQAVSWGVTILLARLLMPADYGFFAIALSVLAVLELLQEFGLGTAIVQRQDLTRSQIDSVFWIVAATSLLLTTATFLAAGPISGLYGEPRLTWAVRILCLTFFLTSLGMVPYNLLNTAVAYFAGWRHLVGTFTPATTTFILARLLGAPAVGLFAMAQGLAEGPHRISTAILSPLSLPVFSKLQGDTALGRPS